MAVGAAFVDAGSPVACQDGAAGLGSAPALAAVTASCLDTLEPSFGHLGLARVPQDLHIFPEFCAEVRGILLLQ